MWNQEPLTSEEPRIVKLVEKRPTGVVTMQLSRYAIGCVLRGTLYIYDGDKRRSVGRGEVIFFGVGRHYVEHVPEEQQPYELILYYYTPEELQRVLMHLNITYQLRIMSNHTCEHCRTSAYVISEGSSTLRQHFQNTNSYLKEHVGHRDETAENIKMTELIYLISSQGDDCLKSRLLRSLDRDQENFEQMIYDHIFTQISIEELASKSNRSLTSFKKEFRRHFRIPPHKWFVQQRLVHSRLLLLSTNKSISEIGNECSFPNTSHYIKLFKRCYKMTPASYRQYHLYTAEREVSAVEELATARG